MRWDEKKIVKMFNQHHLIFTYTHCVCVYWCIRSETPKLRKWLCVVVLVGWTIVERQGCFIQNVFDVDLVCSDVCLFLAVVIVVIVVIMNESYHCVCVCAMGKTTWWVVSCVFFLFSNLFHYHCHLMYHCIWLFGDVVDACSICLISVWCVNLVVFELYSFV